MNISMLKGKIHRATVKHADTLGIMFERAFAYFPSSRLPYLSSIPIIPETAASGRLPPKNIVKEEEIKAYMSMEGIGPYFGSALICLIF